MIEKRREGGEWPISYASHGLGATSLTVKKGTIKKITTITSPAAGYKGGSEDRENFGWVNKSKIDFSLARNTIVVWTIQSRHWAKQIWRHVPNYFHFCGPSYVPRVITPITGWIRPRDFDLGN